MSRREERLYDEPDGKEGKEQRAPFQRDRDRVLYSYEFRRLAGVTQVVHTGEGHVFHNRLTHTLKVAQVGRRLAEKILLDSDDRKRNPGLNDRLNAVGGLNADVVETAALIHDMGHPPFGHVSETVINKCLQEAGVPEGYEGNAQSFRIVNNISAKARSFRGLNLTRATLNASLKYPWMKASDGPQSKKWGYYQSEKQQFEEVRDPLAYDGFNLGLRKCVEAELMDWADDVSYSVHDLDDFYRAGLIPLPALIAGVGAKNELRDFLEDTLTPERMELHKVNITTEEAEPFFTELLKGFLGGPKALDGAFDGRLSQKRAIATMVSELVSRYINGEKDGEGHWRPCVEINSPDDAELVTILPQCKKEVFLLKQLMRYYVFENPALRIQQYGQEQMITTIFKLYYGQIQGRQGHKALPNPYREAIEEIQKRDCREITSQEKARVVSDFVSGLTEIQAMRLYSRATGNSLGSITDLIFT